MEKYYLVELKRKHTISSETECTTFETLDELNTYINNNRITRNFYCFKGKKLHAEFKVRD